MNIPTRFYEEIIAHSREDEPNECCGILAGSKGAIKQLFRAANAERSPYRYTIDAKDLFRIHRACEQREWEFVAIYHSHTHTEAYPSPTDIRLASWPDAYYVIASLEEPDQPVVRAFRILDGQVYEEEIKVT